MKSGSIAALSVAALLCTAAQPAPPRGTPPPLAHFVDELPIPPVLRMHGPGPRRLRVKLQAFQAKIHRDLAPVTLFGYDGVSPGPTIEVESGQRLTVAWENALPDTHIFPLPKYADQITPDVRSVTHLHGAVVAEPDPLDKRHNDDGWPDAWNAPGGTQIAVYPNVQEGSRNLWYHDHSMGSTGRNVAAGLYGMYQIHDAYERGLNLPRGAFDVPLIITTKQLEDDGKVSYTDDITAEFWGNVPAVNGKLWPVMTVEPRKYRFRVLNAANARSFSLKLVDATTRKAGPAFHQLGSDQGFLAAPLLLNDPAVPTAPRLSLFPAERVDLVIDFSAYAGKTLTMTNLAHDVADDEVPIDEIMQFKVLAAPTGVDTSSLPTALAPITRMDPTTATVTRQITFDQMTMAGGMVMQVLNGKHWQDPIEEKPKLGATEVWELLNTLIQTHPFHIHLVRFQVLNRQAFDVQAYLATGKVNLVGAPIAPPPGEMGWKDTIRASPQLITRLIMKFAPYPGFYVYHCHILEHEDMDMMRPFQVEF